MVDLSRIVSVVEIESVRLRAARCRSLVRPSEIAEAISVKPSQDAVVVKEPGEDGSLWIEVAFTLEIRSGIADDDLQAEVCGTFELSYRIPDDEGFSSEELATFGQINAVFNAWPYWRELVQASLARMSLPALTVPVFRLPAPDAVKSPESDDGE